MKKIIILISCIISLCSCKEHKYQVCYRIHYPDKFVEKTSIIKGCREPYLEIWSGGNAISVSSYNDSIRSTAPIEIVNWKEID